MTGMADVTLGIYQPGENEPDVILDQVSFEFLPTNAALLFENVFDAYSVAVADYETVYFASRSTTEYIVLGINSSGEHGMHPILMQLHYSVPVLLRNPINEFRLNMIPDTDL